MNGVGLQFAIFLSSIFSIEHLTDTEHLVLQENYFFNCSARLLQKRIYVAPNRAEKTIIKNYMSTLTVKGNWNIAKGKLKQKFAQLTDDDLQFVEGKEDELIGRIQKRTGQTKEDIQRAVNECGEGKP
jgi:uncharacterized protein YjbJ (UPF0337 family)